METWNMQLIQYLSITLAPVFILGATVLILKILRNKRQQKNDQSAD